MVSMNIYVKIQDLRKQGLRKQQTARALRLDNKTVRKYWDMTPKDYAEYVVACSERTRCMTPYNNFIIEKLKLFPDVSSAQIYDWLREAHKEFKPAESTVRMHVRNLREREGILKPSRIRQYEAVEELPFGQQAQVDMGVQQMVNAYGKPVRLYVFCMVLAASRMKFVYFQHCPFTSETFIRAHQLAFEYFGGRTKEIVYDQDRVLCVSENKGNILFAEKFLLFKMYSGFTVYLCRGHDPESKGKIEAVIKHVKQNFLRFRVFHGIQALNSQALEWLDRTGNGLVHNTIKLIPKQVFEEERKFLFPVPAMEEPSRSLLYQVRKDNVISYRSNRYALPKGTYEPGKKVLVKETEHSLVITDEKGVYIVTHTPALGKGKLVRIRHPDRPPYIKHKMLVSEVLRALGGTTETEQYLKRSLEIYPRYARDNFMAFRRIAQEYASEELTRALSYCAERELFHSSDFKDALVYFQNPEPKPYVPEEFSIPAKYADIQAQERDLAAYSQIYTGGKS